MTLDEYIKAYQEKDCIWGVDDCSSWAAKWIEVSRGVSLDLPQYQSRDEALELKAQKGGLVKLWDDVLGRAGIYPKGKPVKGDVAVIETCRYGQVGVICLEGGYAAWRAERGVSFISPRKLVAVWG
jgi:hypothetical protein